jgi:hypothetical protein
MQESQIAIKKVAPQNAAHINSVILSFCHSIHRISPGEIVAGGAVQIRFNAATGRAQRDKQQASK